MPARISALDKARAAIEEQIATLNDERGRLERALAELGGATPRRGRPRGSAAKARTNAGRPRTATKRTGSRRRGGAPRRDQALRLIKANPGIRPSELAKKMGVAAPYIYRVVPPLIEEDKVRKDGRGYVAT